jgi:hypothetical protein
VDLLDVLLRRGPVADTLAPYVSAAPTEEQSYFLATQQVDEVRHSIFFHRFFKEVIGVGGDSIQDTLASTLPQLNWGYMGVFDRLDRMAVELRDDTSLPKYAQAITLYHLIVEGSLAQPGQHFIEDFFASEETMPGFSAGMVNVSRDEQRHIGFGVKVLSELLAPEHPASAECRAAVVELLREVLPYSPAVFRPPNLDRAYTECYGFSLEDIYAFGLKLVRQRWRTIGYPTEEMPAGVFPFDPDKTEDELAHDQVKMMLGGILGPSDGSATPSTDPELMRLYFGMTARVADPTAATDGPLVYQWKFSDAPPWHLVIDNGSTRAEPGLAADPAVTIESTWTDWLASTKPDAKPLKLLLSRKIRPHGNLRELARMRKVFA